MGLNNTAALVLASIYSGTRKAENVLTIGKQEYLLSYLMHRRVKKKFPTAEKFDWKYADNYLRRLGAKNIDALDINAYQGANVIQDLNLPIDPSLVDQYDLVVDCGSIEHVANISQAMFNMMAMVKPGGQLLFVSPGNNFFGHGCYQISPEFFFTHLTEMNGYRIEKLMLNTNGLLYGKWWEIKNVERRSQRIALKSNRLTFVICVARKIENCNPTTEQQSDYLELWKNKPLISSRGRVYLTLPFALQQLLGIWPLPQIQRVRAMRLLKRVRIRNGELFFLDNRNRV